MKFYNFVEREKPELYRQSKIGAVGKEMHDRAHFWWRCKQRLEAFAVDQKVWIQWLLYLHGEVGANIWFVSVVRVFGTGSGLK